VTEPIVVRNDLWNPADPNAYSGGQPADITHLAEFGATEAGRHDDARWSGILEIIPTKADFVLDLLRANSLWPLLSGLACCAIEMMSFATSKNDIDRWGAFPFRASPRQADVLIVAGRCRPRWPARSSACGSRCRSPSGASRWATARARAAATSGATPRSRASTDHAGRRVRAGLPAPAEGLIFGMMKLQQLVKDRRGHWPERAIGPTVPAGSDQMDRALARRLRRDSRACTGPAEQRHDQTRSASARATSGRADEPCTKSPTSASTMLADLAGVDTGTEMQVVYTSGAPRARTGSG
jgi:NADH-quinone oxidoreductase subunit B